MFTFNRALAWSGSTPSSGRRTEKVPRALAVLATLVLTIATLGVGSEVSLAAAPNNDNFAEATTLPPSTFSDTLNTAEATIESNEPSDCFAPTHSVWYKFDSGNDWYNLSADFSGTDFPWRLAFYTGSPDALQLRWCFPEPSNLTFATGPGEIWYVQVSGVLGGTEYGNIILNWTAARYSPIDVTVTLNPMGSVNRSGDVAIVHGTVSCSRPGPVQVSVTLTQVFAGRLVAAASGSAEVIACINNPRPWSAAVFNGGPIRFGPGIATADAIAYICDELGCGEGQITGTVRLKRG